VHDRQVKRTPSCANEGLKHVPTQERLLVITTASDGVDVRAYDEGSGPSIVVLGPGLDDGTGWRKVDPPLSVRGCRHLPATGGAK
jgi:hypothetical protein